jgi:hypothetical protein
MDYGDDRVSVISMSYFQFTNCLVNRHPIRIRLPFIVPRSYCRCDACSACLRGSIDLWPRTVSSVRQLVMEYFPAWSFAWSDFRNWRLQNVEEDLVGFPLILAVYALTSI